MDRSQGKKQFLAQHSHGLDPFFIVAFSLPFFPVYIIKIFWLSCRVGLVQMSTDPPVSRLRGLLQSGTDKLIEFVH